jgi:predicted ATPase with chaperone activity
LKGDGDADREARFWSVSELLTGMSFSIWAIIVGNFFLSSSISLAVKGLLLADELLELVRRWLRELRVGEEGLCCINGTGKEECTAGEDFVGEGGGDKSIVELLAGMSFSMWAIIVGNFFLSSSISLAVKGLLLADELLELVRR